MKSPAHNVQWSNPGLHQFSLELTVAPYYLDVVGCMTNQALSGSGASFTLSGCDISGLDGDYWITQQNGNEIWVEKNNGWALVFTNDASYTPEFCRSHGPPNPSPPTTSSPTKSPTKNPTSLPNNPGPTVKPTPSPTNQPTARKPTGQPTTAQPTPSPTPKPTSGGTVCCTDRNVGYQTCNTNAWCGANASQCNMCGGVIMSVPLERTGCCTWGGGDCSTQDPSNNMACQYMKSDCEGSCYGTWQSF